jgi:hypothetical protein
VAQFSLVCEALGMPLFLIQCCSAIFKYVGPHRHFVSAKNLLALNTHWPVTNLAVSLLLAKIWLPQASQTWNNFQSHRPFCSLVKLRHVAGNKYTSAATSPLLNVPIYAGDIRISCADHV